MSSQSKDNTCLACKGTGIQKFAPWRDPSFTTCPPCHGSGQQEDKPTSANEVLGLPRDAMRKIKIAFDVDGTLRCNCTDTCRDPNSRIVDLFKVLSTFKNTELYVWSGGGTAYARHFANQYALPVKDTNCIGKIGAPQMDIAIDDIQDTAIGTINLIVREK